MWANGAVNGKRNICNFLPQKAKTLNSRRFGVAMETCLSTCWKCSIFTIWTSWIAVIPTVSICVQFYISGIVTNMFTNTCTCATILRHLLIDYFIIYFFFLQKYGTWIKKPCQLLQDVSFSLHSQLYLKWFLRWLHKSFWKIHRSKLLMTNVLWTKNFFVLGTSLSQRLRKC